MKTVRTAVSIRPPFLHPSANPMNLRFFRKLETIAIAIVSLYTFSRQLKRLNVPHTIRRQHYRQKISSAKTGLPVPRQHQHTYPVMYIKASALMHQRKRKLSLVSDFLRLTHQNYVIRKDGKITYILTGVMKQAKRIRDILTHMRDHNVAFHNSGGFAIFLSASFGAPFVDQLVDRLERIERLTDVVRTMTIWDLECRLISLGRIVIRYYGGYYAELNFQQRRKDGEGGDADTDDREASPSIRVRFEAKNPHRRVQAFLASLLSGRESEVDDFACALSKTFPLLRAFNTIENGNTVDARMISESSNAANSLPENTKSTAKALDDISVAATSSARPSVPATSSSSKTPHLHSILTSSPAIHARNFDWFRLSYANPRCTFDIRLRQAMEKVFWHIEETSKKEWYTDNTSTNNDNNTSGSGTTANATNNASNIKKPTATAAKPSASGPTNAVDSFETNKSSSVNINKNNLSVRPESLTPALKELFAQRGTDWMGLRKCVVAGVRGVEAFVERLDEVVRSCAITIQDDVTDGDGDGDGPDGKDGGGGGDGGNSEKGPAKGPAAAAAITSAGAAGPSNPSNRPDHPGSQAVAGNTAGGDKEVVLIE